MIKSRRYEIGVGLLLAASMVLLAWLALKMGAIGDLGPHVDVLLRVEDAAGLDPGAEIAVAGVKVGEVGALSVADGKAVAHLTIRTDAGLRRDVNVRIRARSILGEKYLQLTPVSADAPLLANGDTLDLLGDQVEIDEIVAALGPVVKAVDPEALGAAISTFVDAVREDPDRVKRLLANVDVTAANAAEASKELPQLVSRANATIAHADASLRALDARLADAKQPLARADDLLAKLQAVPYDETVADARATMADARAALGDARGVLGDVRGIGPDLRKLLANLSKIDDDWIHQTLRHQGVYIHLFPERAKRERGAAPESR